MNDRRYFFDAGLRFECRRCGACCTGAPGAVYVSSSEIEGIARHLGVTPAEFAGRYAYPFRDSYSLKEEADGRCVFFQGECVIYPVRPRQCRRFPFWFENLRSEENWRRVSSACPGIGQGARYTREQILALMEGPSS